MRQLILLLTAILWINVGFGQIRVGNKKVTPSVKVRLSPGSSLDSLRIWFNDKAAYNAQKPIDADLIVVTDSIPTTYSLTDGIYGDITVSSGGTIWTVDPSLLGLTDGDYGDVVLSSNGTVWTIKDYFARTNISEVFEQDLTVLGSLFGDNIYLASQAAPFNRVHSKYWVTPPNSGSYNYNWWFQSDPSGNYNFRVDNNGNQIYSTVYNLNRTGTPVNGIDLVPKSYVDSEIAAVGTPTVNWVSQDVFSGLFHGATEITSMSSNTGFWHLNGVGYLNMSFTITNAVSAAGTWHIDLTQSVIPSRQIIPVYLTNISGTYDSLVGKIEPNGNSITLYKNDGGTLVPFADDLTAGANLVLGGILYFNM